MKHIIISESKRDNLLLSYYEQIQQLGINVAFGQFKSMLLRTFASEGGIHNLSLRSNYYLAGVARYYFNGDLTINKQPALLNPMAWNENNTEIKDQWNDDICKRLDALILILRNSYIDSVGTQMEQPEDFGALPLNKLLRKYGAKINKILGIQPKSKKESQEIDENPNVGNNYTFEIMYSFDDCRKYERPTAPGSWCITYGQQHYNYYARNLKIHYVIFRMDGWEKVERPSDPKNDPNWSSAKPHDLYGNSLIALLQSNTTAEPVYITSRWNHGANGIRCEADHAYTKEEFQQITGVTDDDLKRIFNIWKANKPTKEKGNSTGSERKRLNEQKIRDLKYIQMRINAGENPNDFLTISRRISDGKTGDIRDSITICKTKTETDNFDYYLFLVDRGKIVFETVQYASFIIPESMCEKLVKLTCFNPTDSNKQLTMIYNYVKHKLVVVGGYYKFLSVPTVYSGSGGVKTSHFTINRSTREFALVDVESGEPVQFPNGAYWANSIIRHEYDGKVGQGKYGGEEVKENTCIEIFYDESSGEKYLFHTGKKQFLPNPIEELHLENQVLDKWDFQLGPINNPNGGFYSVKIREKNNENYFYKFLTAIYGPEGTINFGFDQTTFRNVRDLSYGLCSFSIHDEYSDKKFNTYIGDMVKNDVIRTPYGKPVMTCGTCCNCGKYNDYLPLLVRIDGTDGYDADNNTVLYMYVFDKQNRELIDNPYHSSQYDDKMFILRCGTYTGLNTSNILPHLINSQGQDVGNIHIKDIVERNRKNKIKNLVKSHTSNVTPNDISNMVQESVIRILKAMKH